MKTYPVVVSIAGSDSGGGAGIQADLKTISALGAYAATIITAITAQNTLGVRAIQSVSGDVFRQQLSAVMEDFEIAAVKIGMLHSVEIVEILVEALQKYKPNYVVIDPVMVATSGDSLIEDATIESMKTKLFPLATIITPNLKETSILLQRPIKNVEQMKEAANKLLMYGNQSVLIKGGHLEQDDIIDVLKLKTENQIYTFEAKWIASKNLHGTGCTLSSAIATYLALGNTVIEAVNLAKQYVYQAILHGKDITIGHGHGPLNHGFNPQQLKIITKK
ncbi:MAG TPA: bifunctional hydroxymethylpyrimidine kinase/phosphomethylpyrimidine kinase [Bacteroidales bacterium]|nr:bifunctional hydroxymethylpyrimidine kinase/phosphomethylpyrimidine kinase [Bacteroidales bacterium]HON19881.1 bifunctional hydroxymethylpyrimidine kinase/phosphomethylpyrimidine kinase [Bacteroidales bacterium]HOR82208.1 bifunctional hydroxymethylpyrimidine kinase/phosphomethylpyrimidine kinase [Bacteroidales bacterium]HPJ91342.1 bifunctional hydroxymethylpyrimidine kinase/phosphomethylpyrimidine kinase [Bacteroidales bacterium]HQB20064.1 bifunctional hydroxymethylpyrimidine kinase/phosphom